jgi:hypothetical protein
VRAPVQLRMPAWLGNSLAERIRQIAWLSGHGR